MGPNVVRIGQHLYLPSNLAVPRVLTVTISVVLLRRFSSLLLVVRLRQAEGEGRQAVRCAGSCRAIFAHHSVLHNILCICSFHLSAEIAVTKRVTSLFPALDTRMSVRDIV